MSSHTVPLKKQRALGAVGNRCPAKQPPHTRRGRHRVVVSCCSCSSPLCCVPSTLSGRAFKKALVPLNPTPPVTHNRAGGGRDNARPPGAGWRPGNSRGVRVGLSFRALASCHLPGSPEQEPDGGGWVAVDGRRPPPAGPPTPAPPGDHPDPLPPLPLQSKCWVYWSAVPGVDGRCGAKAALRGLWPAATPGARRPHGPRLFCLATSNGGTARLSPSRCA